MDLRRFVVTFALVLNFATLILTALILGNASNLFEVVGGEGSGLDDFLVVGRGDATLLLVLVAFALAGNLALAWVLITARIRDRTRLGRSGEPDRPRITGE